jgi:hypothetical protein
VQRGAEAACRNHDEDRADAKQPHESELFADRRQHEIGVAGGQVACVAEAEARTEQATARHAPDRLRDLIAAAHRVIPR